VHVCDLSWSLRNSDLIRESVVIEESQVTVGSRQYSQLADLTTSRALHALRELGRYLLRIVHGAESNMTS
jgi:hypothetical protein